MALDTTKTVRTPLSITLSVWKALFLREAVTRVSQRRFAWVWLLLEPAVHIVFLMLLYSVVRQRKIGGMDTGVWIMVGLLAFFMFRRTGTQTTNAVNSNMALFAYRQVKPVDTVLVRAALEGCLTVLISICLFIGAGLFGVAVIPADPLAVFEAFFALWLVGLGFGLITSVAVQLVPEVDNIIGLAMTPLYFMSDVIFPLDIVPPPFQDWLLLNPVAHGVAAARLGFAPHYHTFPGVSIDYMYGFALATIFLGLALHNRFAERLVTQ